jgi:hypothetical protein
MDPDLLASLDPPEDAEQSLVTFLAKGLSDDDLDDFAMHAMIKATGNVWRFFCGCCWRGIKRGWRVPAEHTDDCGWYYAGDCDGSCRGKQG